MNFSPQWEAIYQKGQHQSVWPWSELVSLVKRYKPKPLRVLELGCGAGANVRFFQSLGCEYFGIDGSVTAIERLMGIYNGKARFIASDFTRDIAWGGSFDLIVDRGSLTHNTSADIDAAMGLVKSRLTHDGLFVGTDWFSAACSDREAGERTEDPNVRTGFTDGPFADVGVVHFASRSRIEQAFSRFRIKHLAHRTRQQVFPDGATIAAWDIVAGHN
jgi:SAM-dependent methyltransferase